MWLKGVHLDTEIGGKRNLSRIKKGWSRNIMVTSNLLPGGKKLQPFSKNKNITHLRQHGLKLTPTPIRITYNSHILPLTHFTLLAQTRPARGKLLFLLTRYNHVTFSNFRNYGWSDLPWNSCIIATANFSYSTVPHHPIKAHCRLSNGT
jgi:hypothetical protein